MIHVVITGAMRGLGASLVDVFEAAGADVLATSRTASRCGSTDYPPLDMADTRSIETFAAAVERPVDVLINSAAIDARTLGAGMDDRGPFELSAEHFVEQTRVNAAGPMILTRELLPRLEEADGAKVVNITSQQGSMWYATDHDAYDIGYSASKAALNVLSVRTAGLLRERGITVIVVHPGWVRTDMGGPSAALGGEEAASAIYELTSGLTIDDTGRFFRWDGTEHPW